MKQLSSKIFVQLTLLLLLTLAAMGWSNYRFAEANPGGNDFLFYWITTRLYIAEDQSPYSEESSLAIQEQIYGRPALETDDQAVFAYPFYSLLIFSPFSSIEDYAVARALWMTMLQVSMLLTALIAISLAGWRPERNTLVYFFVFSIVWYYGARPMINGNVAILVTLMIAAGFWLLRSGQDIWAGIIFGISTFKPQMVVILVPLLLIWTISHRRVKFVLGFGATLSALLIFSFWQQPTWLSDNLRQLFAYSIFLPPGTPSGILALWWPSFGRELGWAISLFVSIILLIEWWQVLGKDFGWLMWTAALTLVITQLIGVPTTTSNHASMIIVFPLIFAAWERRLGKKQPNSVLVILLIFFAAFWLLFVFTLMPGTQFREHLIMLFPLPIVLLLNLYWLRWWALRPAEVGYPAKLARRKR